jgi:hypothetical protein
MVRHAGPVLVDTMVILECHRIGAWRAIAGGYGVETVEDCVTETQTGFQRRRREQQIDATTLRASLAGVHAVDDARRAGILVQTLDLAVDEGELSLWAHAVARCDSWILCGPDKSSLRLGVRLGFRDRLVSLEGLLADVGYRPKTLLKRHYTRDWLQQSLAEIARLEGMGRP